MFQFSIVTFVLVTIAAVSFAGPYSNSHQEIVTKEDTKVRRLFCPRYPNGEMCKDNTMFTYYSCCGENNDQCCGYTRSWVWIVVTVVCLLLLLLLAGLLLKKFYFDRRSEREHYVSGVRRSVEVKS